MKRRALFGKSGKQAIQIELFSIGEDPNFLGKAIIELEDIFGIKPKSHTPLLSGMYLVLKTTLKPGWYLCIYNKRGWLSKRQLVEVAETFKDCKEWFDDGPPF